MLRRDTSSWGIGRNFKTANLENTTVYKIAHSDVMVEPEVANPDILNPFFAYRLNLPIFDE